MTSPNARTLVESILALLAVMLIAFFSRQLVFGQLKLLENQNPAHSYQTFVWASPEVEFHGAAIQSVALRGYAASAQTLVFACGPTELGRYPVRRGYFQLDQLIPVACPGGLLRLDSDHVFVPAAHRGSTDVRRLSYQIGLVTINDVPVTLADFIAQTKGVHQVEPHFSRVTPAEVLTTTWDSTWYWRIVTGGYAFDGNPQLQQNVAWPFLYPYTVKAVQALFDLEPRSALILTSTGAIFATMFGLFWLGRMLGLGWGSALLPVAMLAFSPFAFFLYGGFSEALFLLWFVISLILTVKEKWIPAAVAIGLLTATRFVGGILLLPLMAYWLYRNQRQTSLLHSGLMLFSMGCLAVLGIGADMYVKALATGEPLAAFLIRPSWGLTPFGEALKVLAPGGLANGEYLPVLALVWGLFLGCLFVLMRSLHKADPAAVVVASSGVLVVGLTWLLNPELHSMGRYAFPLVFSVAGVLALPVLRDRDRLVAFAVIGLAGAAAQGLVMTRLYQGLPPF